MLTSAVRCPCFFSIESFSFSSRVIKPLCFTWFVFAFFSLSVEASTNSVRLESLVWRVEISDFWVASEVERASREDFSFAAASDSSCFIVAIRFFLSSS